MRLVCQTGGSNKFWEGKVQGSALVVTFGKLGTEGQTKKKMFASPSSAADALYLLQQEKLGKGYAAPSGKGKKAAPVAAPTRKKPAPMRVFGFKPGYWYEDPHFPFEVAFVDELTPEQRKRLAPLVKKHLKIGLRNPPWLLSGRWLLFFTDRCRNDAHKACAAVKKAFEAIHKEVPVAEVVFLGLRFVGADGTPSPGVFWPTYDFLCDRFYERERSDADTPPAADPRFEKARR